LPTLKSLKNKNFDSFKNEFDSYDGSFTGEFYKIAEENIDRLIQLQTKSGIKTEQLKTLDKSLQSLMVIPKEITVGTIQAKIGALDQWTIDSLLVGVKESTASQQGGTKLKKHQEINKQLKKRSIRKNKQVRNYIRISKIKPNKRKKSSKKRKSSPNTKLKNLKTIDKLLKRRSLRKSNQIRNYVRLSKMKPNKRKKSSKKRKASSNTKLKNLKTIDKLLKKRSLRKNKQIKNQIDFKSYSD
jgi:hypothetical protein